VRTRRTVYYEQRGRRARPCPKSAILRSPLTPMSRFSGLMSRWITCFWWQYISARARLPMYVADFFSLNVCEMRRETREKESVSQPVPNGSTARKRGLPSSSKGWADSGVSRSQPVPMDGGGRWTSGGSASQVQAELMSQS